MRLTSVFFLVEYWKEYTHKHQVIRSHFFSYL